jgi:hypothetical protein
VAGGAGAAVFGSQLRWPARQDWHEPSSFDEVRELLDDDSFELDEHCKGPLAPPARAGGNLAGLSGPSGIRTTAPTTSPHFAGHASRPARLASWWLVRPRPGKLLPFCCPAST